MCSSTMVSSTHLVMVFVIAGAWCAGASLLPSTSGSDNLLSGASEVLGSVLRSLPEESSMCILVTQTSLSHHTIFKEMPALQPPWGIGVFEVLVDNEDVNKTKTQLSQVLVQAHRLRQLSWSVTVVVVSNDSTSLMTFAEWSLKHRLIGWSTKLLVVTRLSRDDLRDLLTSHWTFSMTKALLINLNTTTSRVSCYVHLPYTPTGAVVKQVVWWSPTRPLNISHIKLFPEKYRNFYGASMNVTTLPYVPLWMFSVEGNTTRYSGHNYRQLVGLSQALNFTIRVLPVRNWAEVTGQVEARKSFMVPVAYTVLLTRLERYDYTLVYDQSSFLFAMAQPVAGASWLSFYYPLSGQVWAAVLISTLIICIILIWIARSALWVSRHGQVDGGAVVLETVGTLLGQDLNKHHSIRHSNHILVASWLVLGVVLSTGYRGSLIASLTIPTKPLRPETIEQLVSSVDRVSLDAWGTSYKGFLSNSNSSVFKALGDLLYVGTKIMDGLNDALHMKRAHIGGQYNMKTTIFQHFTRIDGSSPLYMGREHIFKTLVAWPIPHDAPYKPDVDRVLMQFSENGLYLQWRKEVFADITRERRIKLRKELAKGPQPEQDTAANNRIISLNIVHVQGPLLLLLIGLSLATVTFLLEKRLGS